MTYLAVFDWNGTLFADTDATLVATNACLDFFNVPPITMERLQEIFTFPLIHFYERVGVHPDAYLKHAEQEGNHFVTRYEQAARDCSLAKGAHELLTWLRDHDVSCMILSNHLQPCLDRDVARLGITAYMDCVSGNPDYATITQGLNKQTRLESYIRQNGYAPEKTFIIGDSHEESELARHLGLLGIGITGGLTSRARLERAGANHLIDCLTEVRPILERHWGLGA